MNKKEIIQLTDNHKPFTNMVYELLKSLLDAKKIKYQLIEYRTKKVDSLIEKIERKRITDVNNEILDISGIRIILYYLDDLDEVEKLIRANFEIDIKNSINKEKLYESNEFGYLSRHFIVKINNNRKKLEEWNRFSEMFAEIQIRSVLQHSWASISHELSYKKNYDIPKALNRKLFRLASLFELADEQFLEIKNNHKELKIKIGELDKNELALEKIDLITLEYEISNLDIYNKIVDIANMNGFEIYDDLPSTKDNKREVNKYLSAIILTCNYLDINHIEGFRQLIMDNSEKYPLLFENISKKSVAWTGPKTFIILLAILYNLPYEKLISFSVIWNWDNSLWDDAFEGIMKTKNR